MRKMWEKNFSKYTKITNLEPFGRTTVLHVFRRNVIKKLKIVREKLAGKSEKFSRQNLDR